MNSRGSSLEDTPAILRGKGAVMFAEWQIDVSKKRREMSHEDGEYGADLRAREKKMSEVP